MRRDTNPRRPRDLADLAGPAAQEKGFAWRRPRHTLKGRQDAAAVADSRRRLAELKEPAAGAIDLVFLDESEALTYPYLARRMAQAWGRPAGGGTGAPAAYNLGLVMRLLLGAGTPGGWLPGAASSFG